MTDPEDKIVQQQNRARRGGYLLCLLTLVCGLAVSAILVDLIGPPSAPPTASSIAAGVFGSLLLGVGVLATSYALGGEDLPSKSKKESAP